jgi:glycosyltransferase
LKVSIITATYNSKSMIKSSMDSVISQDYPNVEYVIVDGKSNDNSLDIIEGYIKMNFPIKLISEKDEGVYDAFNKGIMLTTGDIIGFVHADDFLNSNTILSEIVSIFENNDVDGVYGDLQYVKVSDTNNVVRNWKSRPFYPEMIKNAWMPPHPTLFLRKEVYEKHGHFDTSYKISADYEFILRIFKDQFLNFEYLPKVITTMRLGGISNGSLRNIALKVKEDYRAMRKHKVGNIFTLARKTLSKLDQYFKR